MQNVCTHGETSLLTHPSVYSHTSFYIFLALLHPNPHSPPHMYSDVTVSVYFCVYCLSAGCSVSHVGRSTGK